MWNEDDDNSVNDESITVDHMSVVRALQDSYYKTAPATPPCCFALEDAAGEIHNLPILTWPWHEVPGRTNVLHVHEGTYTHMLETILRSNPPVWYMGHVYRMGKQRQLRTWNNVSSSNEESVELERRNNNCDSKRNNSVVLGTLLRIADFRRLEDGRLLVLTQAIERFVVKDVIQSAPYPVANVQLVPDDEEEHVTMVLQKNGKYRDRRTRALLESFQKWHRYEFEQTMLPLPILNKQDDTFRIGFDGNEQEVDPTGQKLDNYLDTSQIVGSALAKVLPYCAFSTVIDLDRLNSERLTVLRSSVADKEDDDLKQQLKNRGILRGPRLLQTALLDKTCNTLERELWIQLDKFLKQTKKAVSPILLGLLPPDQDWPKNFVLEHIVEAIREQDDKFVRVSPKYPAYRRQKRVSYAAAAVLENDESQAQACRLTLLEIPSTKERLAYVLYCLRLKTGGEFQ